MYLHTWHALGEFELFDKCGLDETPIQCSYTNPAVPTYDLSTITEVNRLKYTL